MIMGIFMLLQALPSVMLVFFLLGLPLEMLLVLVLILPEKIRRSWPLIPYIPYLFLRDIPFFFFLGPIAGISLLILGLAA
jgi:hypothetical protein